MHRGGARFAVQEGTSRPEAFEAAQQGRSGPIRRSQRQTDLADTFGNLVNRTLKFLATRYGGIVPGGGTPAAPEERLTDGHDDRLFRKAADEVRSIWRLANGYLAAEAPWASFHKDPERTAVVIRTAVNLLDLAATVAWAFIPAAAEQVLGALGRAGSAPAWPNSAVAALAEIGSGQRVGLPPPLFAKLCARIYEEKISGAKRNRPELVRMLDQIRSDDVIVVSRLDRLARSTRDFLDIAEQLKTAEAGLRSLHEPWVSNGTQSGPRIGIEKGPHTGVGTGLSR